MAEILELADYCDNNLTSQSSRIATPSSIKLPLKYHQQSLVYKCSEIEDSINTPLEITDEDNTHIMKTKIGIIADKVGSGKTLSILSIIANNPCLKTSMPKFYTNSWIYCEQQAVEDNYVPYNLIIVPHTLYKQWTNAIEQYTNLKYFGIFNAKTFKQFEDIFDDVNDTKEYKKFTENQIILLTNTRYIDFMTINKKYWKTWNIPIKFSRIFIDEAENIKNVGKTSCLYPTASFIWFVTSSYKTLLYPNGKMCYRNMNDDSLSHHYNYQTGHTRPVVKYKMEYAGLVKNIMSILVKIKYESSYLKNIIVKNDDSFVDESFSLPDYNTNIIECKMPLYLNILNGNVSNEILTHINAGDLEGAMCKLNCTKVSESDLIKSITKELQTKLENYNIDLKAAFEKTYSTPQAKEDSIKKIKFKITITNNKIVNIRNKLEENNMCTICYGDIENLSISPCCNTKYCFQCISTWLLQSSNCPFCRNKIGLNSLILVSDTIEKVEEEVDTMMNKIESLRKLIQEQSVNEHFKMLIFADYDNSFNTIETMINDIGIKYGKIMGSTHTVNKNITNYKKTTGEDKLDILLLNAQYCANGINLENSSDIVLYHNMSKDKTMQIIGRGQRPGRNGVLNVWKLCYNNEITQ